MALLAVTEVSEAAAGVDLDAVDVAANAGGDSYPNDDDTFLYINNQDASPKTVTITAQRTAVRKEGFGELTIASIAVVVPATSRRLIKVPIGSYSDASGRVQLTYSAVTSVTVAALRAKRQ
jgi:hypothetical protein